MAESTGSGEVEVVGVTKRFGETVAVKDLEPDHPARLLLLPAGPQRLRQDHDPAHDRRSRESRPSAISASAASPSSGCRRSRRGTAMMFQSYALFPHRSVLDNVAFALKMRGAGLAERHAKARELWPRCSSRASPTGCRPSSPAASSSAWRWRAR